MRSRSAKQASAQRVGTTARAADSGGHALGFVEALERLGSTEAGLDARLRESGARAGRAQRAATGLVLGRLAIQRVALVALFVFAAGIAVFEWAQSRGATIEETRTGVIATVVLIVACYLLNRRSLRRSIRDVGLLTNPRVYAGIPLVIGLQLAFTYLPFMHTRFGSEPLDAAQWLAAAGVAALVLPLIALDKRLRRQSSARPARRRGQSASPQRE